MFTARGREWSKSTTCVMVIEFFISIRRKGVKHMAKEMTSIDISTNLDLVRLAEEVARSGEARLLRRADEDVAILMPLTATLPRRKGRTKTEEDYEAFLASAGGWADVDVDTFLEDMNESREHSSRPPVEL